MNRFNRISLIGLAVASLFSTDRPRLTVEGEQTAGAGTDSRPPEAPLPSKAPKAPKKAAPKAKPAKAAKPAKKAKKAKSKGQKVEGMGVLREYAEKYEKPTDKKGERLKTAAGNPVVDSGDEVAVALRGKDLAQVYEVVAKRIGESVPALKKKYGHLNLGQQRMNLGNRLRGHLNAKAKPKAKAAK